MQKSLFLVLTGSITLSIIIGMFFFLPKNDQPFVLEPMSKEDIEVNRGNEGNIAAPWVISLEKDEIKTSSYVIENSLIYAVKNKYRSTVYKRNLQNGTQTKIFEFDEALPTSKSGNLWTGLPPNIALSPDKEKLAFIDAEGLKKYNLRTKNTKIFINQIEKAHSESDDPPKWSLPSLFTTYGLARPLWSSDNQYISFLQSHYEGASFGIIDVESGAYLEPSIYGGYRNLTWSPFGHSYIKASGGGYEGSGLYVVSEENYIVEPDNLAVKFGKPEDTPFLEADFSPDGQKLVFIFEESEDTTHLGIANTDGTGMMIIAEKTDAKMPFFSRDGNSVLYLQMKNGNQVLIEYHLANKNKKDLIILPSEFNQWEKRFWTQEGFLTLVGISSDSELTLGGDHTRMLMLDLENKNIIYASPVFDQFTNFLGLSN